MARAYLYTDLTFAYRHAPTWGNELAGGGSTDLPTRISRLFATNEAFAAIRIDGTVATWGDPASGGNSDAVQHLLHDVQELFATKAAFAALRSDGSVITWGSPMYGGNSCRVEHQLQGGVARVYAAECAFAAVRTDGSLVTWGYPRYGGCCEAVRRVNVAKALLAIMQDLSVSQHCACEKLLILPLSWSMADELAALQHAWETEQQELLRSERVLQALRQAQASLRQRLDDLLDECHHLREEVVENNPVAAACVAVEQEIEALYEDLEALGPRKASLVREQRMHLQAREACRALEIDRNRACQNLREAQKPLQEQHAAVESRIQAAEIQARSLVSAEVQARAEEQREEAQEQLQKAQEEVAEMRLKLADSWVADRVADSEDMQALEEVEKSLQWLANTQHAASVQTQLVERLERKKGSLQQRLREVSEEKAALQSTRVDLGDAGKAMRETMASQSEGYVKQLVGLEEARRTADSDRIKLMQDCADMQDKLDGLNAREARQASIKGRHTQLQVACRCVADESHRLRDMNAALGEMLLSDETPTEFTHDDSDADAVMRLLLLQKKLVDRQESYAAEREQLGDKVRGLERKGVSPQFFDPAPTTPAATSTQAASGSLVSSVRERFSQFRDVALKRA
ncbi:hypothetical protein AK812_SmicGene37142 [Symbiodinium microadriaticum]|uniref:Uncharacterized protein n=1 Tax=Symbiodinium microadriaticum TaxID=2951 RepID=A0A1Q9CH23_SYMMI|nr:hypothetical protein AK812_SmicGene37142 [Symbiodinium microadriaticum]